MNGLKKKRSRIHQVASMHTSMHKSKVNSALKVAEAEVYIAPLGTGSHVKTAPRGSHGKNL